jgi:hypothetical protein
MLNPQQEIRMQLTFLEAEMPLTKSYTKKGRGAVGGSYPGPSLFTSHTEKVDSLEQFGSVLQKHADAGHCLLTNSLTEQIVNARRAKLSDKDELRSWILLDIDGISGIQTVDEFIFKMLPTAFHNVGYVIQHSPSSGIKPGVRCHVFFLLEDQVDVKSVSAWLKYTNLATESLSKQVTLSKNSQALSYPLDWVANNNGRIVYICPPKCVGFDDPVPERITVVEKEVEKLSFNFAAIGSSQMQAKVRAKIDELRKAAGLKVARADAQIYGVTSTGKEKINDKFVEPARITSSKPDNDRFMRCNIDGGDSFAYYYHRDNPTYLHNFKGEPCIKLSLLDAEFFTGTAKPDADALAEQNKRPFVFRDGNTDRWYAGLRKGAEIIEQPRAISSEKKISDYFAQKGGTAPPDPLPTWDRVFDPTSDTQWMPDECQFNSWRPTEYQINATPHTVIPPTIERVIRHVLGSDVETYNYFMNWLAYIYQTRKKSGTAWILHGCPGTGKGVLVNSVIAPIFGHDYVANVQVKNLKGEFNGWMENKIFVNIDEANTDDAGAESKQVVEALKLWITEPFVQIRALYSEGRMTPSYANFIFTSNDFGMIPIQDGDRRFNVGYRQDKPIAITEEDMEQLKAELRQFAGFLLAFEVDTSIIHKTLESAAKETLKAAAQTAMRTFVNAFIHGDFEYFEVHRDQPGQDMALTTEFRIWLDKCVEHVKSGKTQIVTTVELCAAYNMPVSPGSNLKTTKFESLMAKQGFPHHRLKSAEGRKRGWKVKWDTPAELLVELGAHIRDATKTEEEIITEIKKETSRE